MLTQSKMPDHLMLKLANMDCNSAALFGGIAKEEKDFFAFLKEVLEVDPETKVADFILRSKLTNLCGSCKVWAEVESRHAAERALRRLPPQVSVDDLDVVRAAYEASIGDGLPDYLCPSPALYEKMVGFVQGRYEAISLKAATNYDQAEARNTEQSWQMHLPSGTFKQQPFEFTIPLLRDSEELTNRFTVSSIAAVFCKMRFFSDPKSATATLDSS